MIAMVGRRVLLPFCGQKWIVALGIVLLPLGLSVPPVARAAEDFAPSYLAGGLGVVLQTSGGNTNTSNIYLGGSVRLGTELVRQDFGMISLGAFLGYSSYSESTSSSGYGVTATGVANSILIPMTGEILVRRVGGSGFYFGGRAGLSWVLVTNTFTTSGYGLSGSSGSVQTAAVFAFGSFIGYELPLADRIHLSIDVNYFSLGSGTLSSTNSSYTTTFPSTSYLFFQGGILLGF